MKAAKTLNTNLFSKVVRPIVRTTTGTTIHSTRTKYLSAFDPYWTLHWQTVNREQHNAFRAVWENDIGEFKQDLNAEETKLLQRKVNEAAAIDEFEALMKGLWGPHRHAWIRKTDTFAYTKETVYDWIKNSKDSHAAALSLIMGNDDKFNEFLLESGLKKNDLEGFLRDFIFADLRYLCSVIAIDHLGGPEITVVFGNRRKYHFEFPDPIGRTAYWQTAIYDRCKVHDVVLVTAINSYKQKGGVISQDYFRNLLEDVKHNALKDDEWKEHAQVQLLKNEDEFLDDFDRAFNAFQTDRGVTKLKTRFASDWDRFRI